VARAESHDGWPAFEPILRQSLQKAGVDPEKQALHIVVLLDTSGKEDSQGQVARSIAYGIFRRFLIEGDHVSCFPFQNTLSANSLVNVAFDQAVAEQSIRLVMNAPGNEEGHQFSAALQEANRRLGEGAKKAVFVLLSRSDVEGGESTSPQSDSVLLKPLNTGFIKVPSADAKNKPVEVTVFYRLYTLDGFSSLSALPEVRSQVLSGRPDNWPFLDATPSPEPEAPSSPPPSSPAISWWMYVIGGVLCVVVFKLLSGGKSKSYRQWKVAGETVNLDPSTVKYLFWDTEKELVILQDTTITTNDDLVRIGTFKYSNKSPGAILEASGAYQIKDNPVTSSDTTVKNAVFHSSSGTPVKVPIAPIA
jgi:hypothetical protein